MRKFHCNVYELICCASKQVFATGRSQQTGADAGRVAVALYAHHRNAHPQCFAGGGGAVVGHGVECHMDARVEPEVFVDGLCVGDRINARRVDAAGLHPRLQASKRRWICNRLRFEKEP
jgi:hypothetical protein